MVNVSYRKGGTVSSCRFYYFLKKMSFLNVNLFLLTEFLSAEGLLETLDENWNEILPLLLEYNYTVHPKNKDSVSQQIRKEYLQDLPLSRQTFDKIAQVSTFRYLHNL